MLRAATFLAEMDATRVAIEHGEMIRTARTAHDERREMPRDRLDGELHAVVRSQPGAELARPLAHLGAPAGVECRRERLGVEASDGNRLRPCPRLRDNVAPEELIAEEGHNDGRKTGAQP